MKDYSARKGVMLGKPCRHGHIHSDDGRSWRAASNLTCVECTDIRILAWTKTPVGKAARARSKRRRAEKIRASSKAYRQANSTEILEYNRDYRAKNPEWMQRYYNHYNAGRRAERLQAMPAWSDAAAIEAIYAAAQAKSAETGTLHHVDHIVPLKSNRVCGLHIPENLRVIPAKDNLRKGNRWWPGMDATKEALGA